MFLLRILGCVVLKYSLFDLFQPNSEQSRYRSEYSILEGGFTKHCGHRSVSSYMNNPIRV